MSLLLLLYAATFNARTANHVPHYFDLTATGYDTSAGSVWQEESVQNNVYFKRRSHDTHTNEYGKNLLWLCSCFYLYLLSGMCGGDKSGNYTYISPIGNSVIDYFVFVHVRFPFCLILIACVCTRKLIQSITFFVRCQKRFAYPET